MSDIRYYIEEFKGRFQMQIFIILALCYITPLIIIPKLQHKEYEKYSSKFNNEMVDTGNELQDDINNTGKKILKEESEIMINEILSIKYEVYFYIFSTINGIAFCFLIKDILDEVTYKYLKIGMCFSTLWSLLSDMKKYINIYMLLYSHVEDMGGLMFRFFENFEPL